MSDDQYGSASEFSELRMPGQPHGMTLRTRTNVESNSRSVNRDCTFEVTFNFDVTELAEATVQQYIRNANNFLARESFRAANLRENYEYQAKNMPPKWSEDGMTMLPPYKSAE